MFLRCCEKVPGWVTNCYNTTMDEKTAVTPITDVAPPPSGTPPAASPATTEVPVAVAPALAEDDPTATGSEVASAASEPVSTADQPAQQTNTDAAAPVPAKPKTPSSLPTVAIVMAVVVCLVLVGVSYYAFTKGN
jgi:cobalamin biosynthesis Mg chelatase CobN